MILFSRSDNSVLARWWWTIDRWLLVMVGLLLAAGLLLNFAASPAVAEDHGLPPLHFVKRQAFFILPALGLMFAVSLCSLKRARRLAILALPVMLCALVATLVIGPPFNGATRWIPLGPFTLQPSEFLKPVFILFSAWILSAQIEDPRVPGWIIAGGIFLLIIALLALQPDFGQIVLITLVFVAQLALAGLRTRWLAAIGAAGLLGAALAYVSLPHVADRIDSFVNPDKNDTYQSDTSVAAFKAGGLAGRGPGEGQIKHRLPDAHTDYIFAVAGEEFGVIACLALVMAFAVIVLRGLRFLMQEDDPYVVLAAGGLVLLFGAQAIINIGVTLALLPAKGMTLPFISYGGSSLWAMGLAMGFLLALTRCNRLARFGSKETLIPGLPGPEPTLTSRRVS